MAPRFPDPSRWACGLAVWDILANGSDELVDRVSDWLSDPAKLGTGYRLVARKFKELDINHPLVGPWRSGRAFDDTENSELRDHLLALLLRTQLLLEDLETREMLAPHDVGEGIWQWLPVVVT